MQKVYLYSTISTLIISILLFNENNLHYVPFILRMHVSKVKIYRFLTKWKRFTFEGGKLIPHNHQLGDVCINYYLCPSFPTEWLSFFRFFAQSPIRQYLLPSFKISVETIRILVEICDIIRKTLKRWYL